MICFTLPPCRTERDKDGVPAGRLVLDQNQDRADKSVRATLVWLDPTTVDDIGLVGDSGAIFRGQEEN